MEPKDIVIIIEGEKLEYSGHLDTPLFGKTSPNVIYGHDGLAKKGEKSMYHIPSEKAVAVIAVWGEDQNGNYWQINGLFSTPVWGKDSDDRVILNLGKRIT